MDYYKKKLYIPRVDEQDTIIGEVERWEAHEKGILHRGFTIALSYKGLLVCQMRRHPVFDGVIDLTASSHPLYHQGKAQDIQEAISLTLEREWSMKPGSYTLPQFVGKVMYSSFDGTYTEHEICHFYEAAITEVPQASMEFSYGFGLFSKEELRDPKKPFLKGLAPWVHAYLKSDMT